ncbi:MAG: hypothetical protein K8R21_03185, partial [Leptospira sp.]|nr:hypothetical protein [Leptospira sp.]
MYEKIVNSNASNRQVLKTAVLRLEFLYEKFGRIEDITLLNAKMSGNYGLNKKMDKIIRRLSSEIGASEEELHRAINLCMKKNVVSTEKLAELIESSRNHRLFRFLFALKIKMKDFKSLHRIFEITGSPDKILYLTYLVKSHAENTEDAMRDIGSLPELTARQKSDILFLRGIDARNSADFRMSARYLLMSSSFARRDRGRIEAAKSLLIAGKKTEACSLIDFTLQIENESDEVLSKYCSGYKSSYFKQIRPSLKVLSEQDNGLIFQKILE